MKQGGKRAVSGGGSKIVVFRDEDVGMEESGSKIGVFRDEVGQEKATKTSARAGDEDVVLTSAPKNTAVAGFTPFRDEVRPVSFLSVHY